MSFIYITHKLSEVFKISDRVIVMRDGRHVGSRETSQCTERDLVAMMVGREIAAASSRSRPRAGDECLRVEGFSRRGVFSDISFLVRKGEILGFAGLVGSGRTELARAIFSVDPRDGGRSSWKGSPCARQLPTRRYGRESRT